MARISLYLFDDVRDFFDLIKEETDVPVWKLSDVLIRLGMDTLLRDPDRAQQLLLDNDIDVQSQTKLHQVVARWWEDAYYDVQDEDRGAQQ